MCCSSGGIWMCFIHIFMLIIRFSAIDFMCIKQYISLYPPYTVFLKCFLWSYVVYILSYFVNMGNIDFMPAIIGLCMRQNLNLKHTNTIFSWVPSDTSFSCSFGTEQYLLYSKLPGEWLQIELEQSHKYLFKGTTTTTVHTKYF